MLQSKNLHIMVIVHGKSELSICRYIASNLKIKQEIISEEKGESSIQINGLMKQFNKLDFKSFTTFTNKYRDIQTIKKKLIEFKIFPIMDTDDCDKKTKENYKKGLMFNKDYFLTSHIIPIFNDPNLEVTMGKMGININDKKEYSKKFPVNRNDITDLEKIKIFSDKLREIPNTNMEIYVDYCIKIAESELINPNRNKLRR